jgi:hypothetical protein
LDGLEPQTPRAPWPQRRSGDRRSGGERRHSQRRSVRDRRGSPERRQPGFSDWVTRETAAEHVRNAMQLLIGGLGKGMSPDDLRGHAEAAIARLSLALAALEKNSRP